MVRGQWGKFGQDAGVTPLLFFEGHPGPRFNDSSEGWCLLFCLQCSVPLSLYWGVRTHTDHRVSTPCWPH